MPWKPMWPISVCRHLIMYGRMARPFQAVDCSDRLYTVYVPGYSLLYWLPDTSHERTISPSSSTAQTRWLIRSYTTRLPEPEFSGSGGASSPTDDTDDSGYPQLSIAPSGGGGVRTTSSLSSGQIPSSSPVSLPATPSTNRPRSSCRALTAALVAKSNSPVSSPS